MHVRKVKNFYIIQFDLRRCSADSLEVLNAQLSSWLEAKSATAADETSGQTFLDRTHRSIRNGRRARVERLRPFAISKVTLANRQDRRLLRNGLRSD